MHGMVHVIGFMDWVGVGGAKVVKKTVVVAFDHKNIYQRLYATVSI